MWTRLLKPLIEGGKNLLQNPSVSKYTDKIVDFGRNVIGKGGGAATSAAPAAANVADDVANAASKGGVVNKIKDLAGGAVNGVKGLFDNKVVKYGVPGVMAASAVDSALSDEGEDGPIMGTLKGIVSKIPVIGPRIAGMDEGNKNYLDQKLSESEMKENQLEITTSIRDIAANGGGLFGANGTAMNSNNVPSLKNDVVSSVAGKMNEAILNGDLAPGGGAGSFAGLMMQGIDGVDLSSDDMKDLTDAFMAGVDTLENVGPGQLATARANFTEAVQSKLAESGLSEVEQKAALDVIATGGTENDQLEGTFDKRGQNLFDMSMN